MSVSGVSNAQFPAKIFHCSCAETLRKKREEMQSICGQYMNRPVRVETMDGEVVEGTMVHVDRRYVHIAVHPLPDHRPVPGIGPGFGPGYGHGPGYYPVPRPGPYPVPAPGIYPNPSNVILPLVLYELLVISLLA
jgi:hypothetical protein